MLCLYKGGHIPLYYHALPAEDHASFKRLADHLYGMVITNTRVRYILTVVLLFHYKRVEALIPDSQGYISMAMINILNIDVGFISKRCDLINDRFLINNRAALSIINLTGNETQNMINMNMVNALQTISLQVVGNTDNTRAVMNVVAELKAMLQEVQSTMINKSRWSDAEFENSAIQVSSLNISSDIQTLKRKKLISIPLTMESNFRSSSSTVVTEIQIPCIVLETKSVSIPDLVVNWYSKKLYLTGEKKKLSTC